MGQATEKHPVGGTLHRAEFGVCLKKKLVLVEGHLKEPGKGLLRTSSGKEESDARPCGRVDAASVRTAWGFCFAAWVGADSDAPTT